MRRCLTVVAVCAFAFSAVANDRANAEWQKYMDRAMNACVPGGSVYLTYSPLDRRDWNPVQFASDLKPDLMKRVAANEKIRDEKTLQTINTEVNTIVNEHLQDLRNGTYNKIEVKLPGARFEITPANDKSEQVVVWHFKGAGSRLSSFYMHESATEKVYLMQPDGTTQEIGRNNRPSWMTTEDVTEATEDAGVKAGRAHGAHFTKCE